MPDTLTRQHDGLEIPVPGTYTIDVAHSSIAFLARHLVVSKVRGEFESFSGTIVVGEEPSQSSVEVTIDVNSISTHEERRDAHLRSGDFFEVETYPTITFKSTGVRSRGGSEWAIDGDLTIKGVTKSVTLDAEFNGAVNHPQGGSRVGFSAKTEVIRDDFGVSFNMALEAGGVMVGPKIQIDIEIEAIRET